MNDTAATDLVDAPAAVNDDIGQQVADGYSSPLAPLLRQPAYEPPPLSMDHKKRLVLGRIKALDYLFLPDEHRMTCDPSKRSRENLLQHEAAMEAIIKMDAQELSTVAETSYLIVGDYNINGNVEQWEAIVLSGDIEDIQGVSDHLEQLSDEGVTVHSLAEQYGSDKAKKQEDADVLAQPWNNADPEFMQGHTHAHTLVSMFRNGSEEVTLRTRILDQLPESIKDTRLKLDGLEMRLNQIKDRKHLQALEALAQIFRTSKPEHQDDLLSFRHVISAPKDIALSLYAHMEYLYRNPGTSLTFIRTATKLKEGYGVAPSKDTWRIPVIEKHMQIRKAYELKFGDYEIDNYFNNSELVNYVQSTPKKSDEVTSYVEAYGVKNFTTFACAKYMDDYGHLHRKE